MSVNPVFKPEDRERLPWGLRSLSIERLWQDGYTGGGITVGLLDSGVYSDHPALYNKITQFRNIDCNAEHQPGDLARDHSGHGTHIAGIIAGSKINNIQIGVAPSARLIVAAVFEKGLVVERILTGLDWILKQNIQVLCLPFGLVGNRPIFEPLLEELRARDILIVAPSGNDSIGHCRMPGNSTRILTVGAVDYTGNIARFSGCLSDGSTDCIKPELLAPGSKIVSTSVDYDLEVKSGTSMACAFVAGVAALLRQAIPNANAEAVKQALIETAATINPEDSHRARKGIIRPESALSALNNSPVLPYIPSTDWTTGSEKHDPRLSWLLSITAIQDYLKVIIVTDPSYQSSIDELLLEVKQQTGFEYLQVRKFSVDNIYVIRARVNFIQCLIGHKQVITANAVDIDLKAW